MGANTGGTGKRSAEPARGETGPETMASLLHHHTHLESNDVPAFPMLHCHCMILKIDGVQRMPGKALESRRQGLRSLHPGST